MKTVFRSIISLLFISAFLVSQAQDRPIYQRRQANTRPAANSGFEWEKTFVGVTLTPGFGYGGLSIYGSLTGGYQISERFSVAAGPLYMFYQWYAFNKQKGYNDRNDANIFGGRVVSDFIVFRGIGLHGELEVMNAVSDKGFDELDPHQRQTLVNPLIGIATTTQSNGGFRNFTILYNLNYIDKVTPYGGLFGISNIPVIIRASLYFNIKQ